MQRELAANMVLSADFIYSRGSNLATLINLNQLNQPLPTAASSNALGALPYPNFGFVESRADNGRSDYEGVDIGLENASSAVMRSAWRIHWASPRTTRPSS